jgi:5-methylcytosine-specific restriction endonuclease McrA
MQLCPTCKDRPRKGKSSKCSPCAANYVRVRRFLTKIARLIEHTLSPIVPAELPPCAQCRLFPKKKQSSLCVKCFSLYQRAWKIQNKQKVKEQAQEYRKDNADRLRVYDREWKRKHSTVLNAKTNARRKADPERHRAYRLAAYNRNPQKYSRLSVLYSRNHPDKTKAICQKYRAKKAGNGGSFTGQEWADLKALYNFSCLRCGKREPEITLTADHILPVSKGGSSDIANIAPLCRSCNSSKGAKHVDYRVDTQLRTAA